MGFGSLHVGATGLLAHGERMQVIGNNLANVNTIGFKKSSMLFRNLMSQDMPDGSMSPSQIGKGVAVQAVQTSYLQGGLMDGDYATDMAVDGKGFFGVRNAADDSIFYTRAGNFRFDVNGNLVNPSGLRVQGFAIDRETGDVDTSVSDVVLPYEEVEVDGEVTRAIVSQPLATTLVSQAVNLDANANDRVSDPNNPFFAMLGRYNAQASGGNPFDDLDVAYSATIKVWDDAGESHEVTAYFDRVADSAVSNGGDGYAYWEYVIAMDPSEDAGELAGTSGAGLLSFGTLTFGPGGEIAGHSAYTYTGASSGATALGSWGLAEFSDDGIPQFDATFAGASGAAPGSQTIAWDFGMHSDNGAWVAGAQTASGVGTNAAALGDMGEYTLGAISSTGYPDSMATLSQSQNGYGEGFLDHLSVDREGFLVGHFTNGATENLFQIGLYRFPSEYGLRHEGNNLFGQTEASGAATVGAPDTGGRGFVAGQSLEASNTDMAREFADMIVTQRGFQSNSKVITTSDSILQTTINTKK